MKRILCAVVLVLVAVLPIRAAERDSIMITFGRDEGMSALDQIVREQGQAVKNLVDCQLKDPALFISVESNADGVRYRKDHIKKNVVMSEERGVTGGTILKQFGADMGRVYTVGTNVESDTGSVYRYVIFRLITIGPTEPKDAGIPILAPSAPAKPEIVSTTTVYTNQFLSQVWLGMGVVYLPTERLAPMAEGQWGNERLRFICEAAYSLYHQDRTYAGEELNVMYRYVLVGIAWRAIRYSRFDLIAAWQRSEVYALDYGMYAEKLEGPAFGLRLEMSDHIALAGLWTPCEVNVRGQDKVEHDDGRFSISLSLFTSVLGGNQE